MNITENEFQPDTSKPHLEYISQFREKNEYEQKINDAWRIDESDCVENLLAHSEISDELNGNIQDLAFQLAHALRERKGSNGKAGIGQGVSLITN